MADSNQRQQKQQKKECVQPRTINDLPFEIISEIVKCAPGSAAKLGLTCKTFNKILEKELKENQEVFKHNKSIYRKIEGIEQHHNDIGANFLMMPGWISEWEYKNIMKILDDRERKLVEERQCINSKRFSKDISKNGFFYTENVCNDCAHLCFNVEKKNIINWVQLRRARKRRIET